MSFSIKSFARVLAIELNLVPPGLRVFGSEELTFLNYGELEDMVHPEGHSTSLGLSPASTHHDYLSDTGVMRILGDFDPPEASSPSEETQALRACPLCSRGVHEASTVCCYCQCYLGPAPDYLRSLKQ